MDLSSSHFDGDPPSMSVSSSTPIVTQQTNIDDEDLIDDFSGPNPVKVSSSLQDAPSNIPLAKLMTS